MVELHTLKLETPFHPNKRSHCCISFMTYSLVQSDYFFVGVDKTEIRVKNYFLK